MLVLSITATALLDLGDHGVDLVGEVPTALPDPALPDVGADDLVTWWPLRSAFSWLSAEPVGVARSLATEHGYRVDPNRDLVGSARPTCSRDRRPASCSPAARARPPRPTAPAGARSSRRWPPPVLILLTGAFLAPLFEDLPQATLGAIVVVAVAGFFGVGELRRFVHIRRSAVVLAALALAGVLALGRARRASWSRPGCRWCTSSQRLAGRPSAALARDPAAGTWGRIERHPDWQAPAGVLAVRSDGPLLLRNADAVKQRILALADIGAAASAVVLELAADH